LSVVGASFSVCYLCLSSRDPCKVKVCLTFIPVSAVFRQAPSCFEERLHMSDELMWKRLVRGVHWPERCPVGSELNLNRKRCLSDRVSAGLGSGQAQ